MQNLADVCWTMCTCVWSTISNRLESNLSPEWLVGQLGHCGALVLWPAISAPTQREVFDASVEFIAALQLCHSLLLSITKIVEATEMG